MKAVPQFERRAEDINVKAVATRVAALEGWAQVMDLELKNNTRLTTEMHSRVERIEANTEDIVAAVQWVKGARDWWAKWIKRFAWFSKYIVIPIGGAIVTLYAVAEHAGNFDLLKWLKK